MIVSMFTCSLEFTNKKKNIYIQFYLFIFHIENGNLKRKKHFILYITF